MNCFPVSLWRILQKCRRIKRTMYRACTTYNTNLHSRWRPRRQRGADAGVLSSTSRRATQRQRRYTLEGELVLYPFYLFNFVRGQLPAGAREIRIQLLRPRGTRDDRGYPWMCEKPRYSELAHRAASCFGKNL